MKRQDILAQCLADIESGRLTPDDCLERHPDLAGELRPLVEIARTIRPVGPPATAEFRARLRRHLLDVMQLDAAKASARPLRRHRVFLRAATGLAGTLILAALGTAGTVYAAQASLPGDTLYPVKTAAERVQLTLTLNHEQKAFLHLKLVQRRIDEVAGLATRRPEADASAPALAAAEALDSSVEEIRQSVPLVTQPFAQRLSYASFRQQVALDELTLAASPATQSTLQSTIAVLRRGKLIADVVYGNSAFLGTRPSVLDETLEADRFEVAGKLTAVDDHTWRVDGMTLEKVAYGGKPPAADARVRVTGIVRDGLVFVTSVAPEPAPAAQVTIAGVFQGASGDGTVWNVGGIAVPVTGTGTAPPVGKDLQIKGVTRDGVLNVSQLETRDLVGEGVHIEATLSRVDQGSGAITLLLNGVRVKVYVSQATILASDRNELSLAGLKEHEGAEVRVSGVYRDDGSLRVREVSVEHEDERDGEHDDD